MVCLMQNKLSTYYFIFLDQINLILIMIKENVAKKQECS